MKPREIVILRYLKEQPRGNRGSEAAITFWLETKGFRPYARFRNEMRELSREGYVTGRREAGVTSYDITEKGIAWLSSVPADE